MSLDDILKNLTFEQKDFLRACMIRGWSLDSYSPLTSIESQILEETNNIIDQVLFQLVNYRPPLIEVNPDGDYYRFTRVGAQVAEKIFLEPPAVPIPAQKPLSVKGIRRGTNNREMAKYAMEADATVIKGDNHRCNFCGHAEVYFVKKGDMLLCQICFSRGRRFSP